MWRRAGRLSRRGRRRPRRSAQAGRWRAAACRPCGAAAAAAVHSRAALLSPTTSTAQQASQLAVQPAASSSGLTAPRIERAQAAQQCQRQWDPAAGSPAAAGAAPSWASCRDLQHARRSRLAPHTGVPAPPPGAGYALMRASEPMSASSRQVRPGRGRKWCARGRGRCSSLPKRPLHPPPTGQLQRLCKQKPAGFWQAADKQINVRR